MFVGHQFPCWKCGLHLSVRLRFFSFTFVCEFPKTMAPGDLRGIMREVHVSLERKAPANNNHRVSVTSGPMFGETERWILYILLFSFVSSNICVVGGHLKHLSRTRGLLKFGQQSLSLVKVTGTDLPYRFTVWLRCTGSLYCSTVLLCCGFVPYLLTSSSLPDPLPQLCRVL